MPFCLLLAAGLWVAMQWGETKLQWINLLIGQNDPRNSEMADIHWQRFNDRGILSIDTQANGLIAYQNGLSKLISPHIQVRHSDINGQLLSQWHIQSHDALHHSNENTLDFHEDVYMERHEGDVLTTKIWSNTMNIDLNKNLASTDDWTRIWRTTGTVRSHGVTIDLNHNIITFHERVSGTYRLAPKN